MTTTHADVPPERSPHLDLLDPFVGQWQIEAVAPALWGATESGAQAWATFEWLEGRFFLIQRWNVDFPEAPDGIAIIGLEPSSIGDGHAAGPLFTQRYFDSRGVHRVYAMTLDSGLWRLWRDAPGFAQRFGARFSDDGTTIEGTWETSSDGVTWERDIALRYHRVGDVEH